MQWFQFTKEGVFGFNASHPPEYVKWVEIAHDQTYGDRLRQVAKSASGDCFMVVEHDIAVSWELIQELSDLHVDPSIILAVNYNLYPVSTYLTHPVIAHRDIPDGELRFIGSLPPGSLGSILAFGLGCTRLPRDFVLDHVDPAWDYPLLDTQMSYRAASLGVGMVAYAPRSPIVHLHY